MIGSTFVEDAPPEKTSSEHGEVFSYPSRRLGISSDFSLYLITVGAYHHALACIHLRLDDIQGYTLMIYNFFEIDDIHATGVISYNGSTFVKLAPPLFVVEPLGSSPEPTV